MDGRMGKKMVTRSHVMYVCLWLLQHTFEFQNPSSSMSRPRTRQSAVRFFSDARHYVSARNLLLAHNCMFAAKARTNTSAQLLASCIFKDLFFSCQNAASDTSFHYFLCMKNIFKKTIYAHCYFQAVHSIETSSIRAGGFFCTLHVLVCSTSNVFFFVPVNQTRHKTS